MPEEQDRPLSSGRRQLLEITFVDSAKVLNRNICRNHLDWLLSCSWFAASECGTLSQRDRS